MKAPILDSKQAAVISLPEETQYSSSGIVSRTLLQAPNARIVLFGFDAGQELTEHASTSLALIQVLSGECDFDVNGQTHRLRSGDVLYMPPHAPHAVRALTRFSMLLTLLKSEPALSPQFGGMSGAISIKPTIGQTTAEAGTTSEPACLEMDLRGLEPPEPMVRILEKLESLPPTMKLRARTNRRPMHLYPLLQERCFTAETTELEDGSFTTLIERL